jgi:hypothetical protein
MCTAYGCPMLGTMSPSTGGGDWFCFAHFGKDVGRFQRITSELHRVKWLIAAISDIRNRAHTNYYAALERIQHDFTLAQRKDLLMVPKSENDEQWLIRLERELVAMLAEPPPQQQDALPLAVA